MEEFKWKESHAVDRTQLLRGNIPTAFQVLHEIDVSKATQAEKSLMYLMYCTSCRVSEACAVRSKDVHIYLKGGREGREINHTDSRNYMWDPRDNSVIDKFDIEKIKIDMPNLKRGDKRARKVIPIMNNELFSPAIWHLVDHMRFLNNPEALLYDRGRKNAWWAYKRYKNVNEVMPFPHSSRHISLSNLTKSGLDPASIQLIAGWSGLSPFKHYIHLNTEHIEKKLTEAYGPSLEKLNTDNKPLSLTQSAVAHLGAFEVGRKESDKKVLTGRSPLARKQHYIESIIKDGDELITERTTSKIRSKVDMLRKTNPYVKQFNNQLRNEIVKKRDGKTKTVELVKDPELLVSVV